MGPKYLLLAGDPIWNADIVAYKQKKFEFCNVCMKYPGCIWICEKVTVRRYHFGMDIKS